ncbi:MAG: hypothetical protein A2132_05725 [Nitrospirae bacterium RBG_16_43_11]|nr:MAG: hypothetical protein A2132_05725 [Nitrospirae bacterium RBG_16_43_11]
MAVKTEGLFRSSLAVFILLMVLSVTVYLNSLDNGFHFDDIHHIVENRYLRSLNNIPRFFIDIDTFSAESAVSGGHFRPLVLTSHAVSYAISGANPVGYHIVSLIFHVGSAFMLFLIVRGMLGGCVEAQSRETLQSGFFIALAASLIFAVHPFNSEAVNYITARSSLMSGFFYFLAFYCWVRYRGGEIEDRSKKLEVRSQAKSNFLLLSSYFYLSSLLAFLLSLLSKEMAITLPVVLFIYDLYFIPVSEDSLFKRFKRHCRVSAAILPFVLVISIPYIIASIYLADSRISSKPINYYLHLLTQAKVIVKYIYLLFVPAGLSVEHNIHFATSIWEASVIGSIVLIVLIVAILLILYRHKDVEWRSVSFFTFWFFISLLPVVLVVLQAPLQENRGYIAAAGFAVFAGTVLNKSVQWSRRHAGLKILLLILVLILYSAMTIERNVIWASEYNLWEDAVNKSPMSWRAHYALGKVYYNSRLEDLAIKEIARAVEIKPDYFDALHSLGVIYMKRGDLVQAREMLEKAVDAEPYWINGRMSLGEVYEKLGQRELAFREFETAVRLGERLDIEERVVLRAKERMRWMVRQNEEVRSEK